MTIQSSCSPHSCLGAHLIEIVRAVRGTLRELKIGKETNVKKMMMVMLMLIGAAGEGNAQPDSLWSRTYGGGSGDVCTSIIQTADGGFAMAGTTESFGAGDGDFWLVRTNAEGESLWSRTFDGEGYDACHSLIQTADGGFALAGENLFIPAAGYSVWLVRTNAEGDSLWSRTYGGRRNDYCTSIIQTADGGFALAGYTNSLGAGRFDFWLVRTNAQGDSLWSRTFGAGNDEQCCSIIQTADGGFALAGTTESFGAGVRDFWLVRTNAEGDNLWSRAFGGESQDYCYSLIQTADGGFALAGETYSFGVGRFDFWLVRTNADGDSLWSRAFGGGDYDRCYSLIQTMDEGFALAGSTGSFGAGITAFWLMRTNAEGDSLWSRVFGGGEDVCSSLIQTADRGFALAGSTRSFGAGGSDFWLVKTGADPVSVSDSPFQLSTFNFQLCPNPFNASTTLTYSLPRKAPVELGIYDLSGRLVETLVYGVAEAGEHSVVWTAPGSGVYFAVLNIEGEGKAVKKVVCIR